MKKTIWTSITAIICVLLVSLSLKDGVKKIADAKVEAASIAAESAGNNGGMDAGLDAGLDMGGSLDVGTDAGTVTPDAGTDAGTATPDAGTATPDAGTATPDAGAKPDENKAPTAPAEIVNYYNNALNKVINEKVGYKKARVTDLKTLEGGKLLEIELVVEMVNDFLGVGTTDYENKKGKAEFLSKASLTVADLTAAKCDVNGDVYTITLGLKNGQSQASASGSSDNTPLQRSGLYVGKGDKKAFDYKSSENIHTAINGVDNCTAESAKEQVTNAKIVATINSKTGQMTGLTVTWDWAVQLTNIKYTVIPVKTANGTATSTVKVSNFQW